MIKQPMSNQILSQVCEFGTFYSPAQKHYNNKLSVVCDKCLRENLDICIGYEKYDLCFNCVQDFVKMNKPLVQPFGQPLNPPFGQPLNPPFGQPITFGQPFNQPFGQSGQPFGQPLNQLQFNQPSYFNTPQPNVPLFSSSNPWPSTGTQKSNVVTKVPW